MERDVAGLADGGDGGRGAGEGCVLDAGLLPNSALSSASRLARLSIPRTCLCMQMACTTPFALASVSIGSPSPFATRRRSFLHRCLSRFSMSTVHRYPRGYRYLHSTLLYPTNETTMNLWNTITWAGVSQCEHLNIWHSSPARLRRALCSRTATTVRYSVACRTSVHPPRYHLPVSHNAFGTSRRCTHLLCSATP